MSKITVKIFKQEEWMMHVPYFNGSKPLFNMKSSYKGFFITIHDENDPPLFDTYNDIWRTAQKHIDKMIIKRFKEAEPCLILQETD